LPKPHIDTSPIERLAVILPGWASKRLDAAGIGVLHDPRGWNPSINGDTFAITGENTPATMFPE